MSARAEPDDLEDESLEGDATHVSLPYRLEQRLALIVARPLFALAALAGRVLPRRFLLAMGGACSRAVFALFPGVRANLLANARHILGPGSTAEERRALARETLASFAGFLLEWVAPSCAPRADHLLETARGRQHFLDALAAGKGLIAATLHMGNYELPARQLARTERGVAIAFNRERIGLLELIRSRHRRAMHLDEIAIDRSRFFAIDLLRRLERGGIVLLAVDQMGVPDGLECSFLHGKARFPLWPARLAQQSGAPIVPAFCVRAPGGGYRLEISPPVWPRDDATPEDLTRQVVGVLEKFLGDYPGQWLMVHRFWSEAPGP